LSAVAPGVTTPQRQGTTRLRRRRSALRSSYNLLAGVLIVLIGFPVYWMVATAFKPGNKALQYTPQWFPWPITFDNITAAVHKDFFLSSLRNSVEVVLSVVVLALFVGALAALAVSRFSFRGRSVFIVLMVGIQMVPLAGLVIPLFRVLADAHLTDRIPGLVLAYLTFVLPFTVWTLRGFIINIPRELEEAAMVDGSTRLGAFLRILLPLAAPGLVATAVFTFITSWNEYIFARVLLNDQAKQTATVWLSYFLGSSRHTDWGALMAGSTLIAIPVVIFFLLIQRRIAFGLTAGAVKG
jgi:N,N'-diacetylchitobiose transport system permease protein